jgi:hypothetical protein
MLIEHRPRVSNLLSHLSSVYPSNALLTASTFLRIQVRWRKAIS